MITSGILEQYFLIFLEFSHLKCYRSHLGCDWGNSALVPKFLPTPLRNHRKIQKFWKIHGNCILLGGRESGVKARCTGEGESWRLATTCYQRLMIISCKKTMSQSPWNINSMGGRNIDAKSLLLLT